MKGLPVWNLPGAHAARGERSDVVLIVNPTHTDDITLVGRIVECSIQGSIVADG